MDYAQVLSILQMVYNRLPFLAVTPANATLMGTFIYEAMVELDACFRIDTTNPLYDASDPLAQPTWVGDEAHYSNMQKLIVADLTAVAILTITLAGNTAGRATGLVDGVLPVAKYLSRTKAGSVEAEWKGFDVTPSAGFYTTGATLLDFYKTAALRRALNLGCVIDITTEIGQLLWLEYRPLPLPFMVVKEYCPCNDNVPVSHGGINHYPI